MAICPKFDDEILSKMFSAEMKFCKIDSWFYLWRMKLILTPLAVNDFGHVVAEDGRLFVTAIKVSRFYVCTYICTIDSIFVFYFYFLNIFVANAFISPFNTQAMHIKSSYTQQHCYVSLKTLHIPWRDSNHDSIIAGPFSVDISERK
jgi:hypothetical protein